MRRLTLIVFIASIFASCEPPKASSDIAMQKQTEKMTAEAQRRLGLPNIKNFTEKRFMKMIYELRDREVKTYSYFMDMTGRLHFLCNSIGYGIPASVQYSSPSKLVSADLGQTYGDKAMPQAEPNGMFMPDGLDATYVLCINNKGQIKPVYSEPKLIVSPFELRSRSNLTKTNK